MTYFWTRAVVLRIASMKLVSFAWNNFKDLILGHPNRFRHEKREHSTLPGVLCQAHDSKTCLFDGTEIVSLWCCCSFFPLCRVAGTFGDVGTGPVPHQILNNKLTLFQSGGGGGRGHIMPITLAWPHQVFWHSCTPAPQLSLLTREIMTGEIKNTLPKKFSRGVGRPPTLKLSPDGKKSVNKAGFHFNFMPKKKNQCCIESEDGCY